jgi:ABC-2 type transport system permease protein
MATEGLDTKNESAVGGTAKAGNPLKDTWYVCWRELKHFVRSRALVFTTLLTPFIWLLFMGNTFNFTNVGSQIGTTLEPALSQIPNINTPLGQQIVQAIMSAFGNFDLTQFIFHASSYLAFFTPGIIALTTIMGGIMGGNTIVWDRRLGFLNKMLAAPISRTSIATGKIIASSIRTGMQAGIIALVAVIVLGVQVATGPVGFALAIMIAMLLCLGFASLSMAIAATLKNMEAMFAIMSLLSFPLLFMSPAMFPLTMMPAWLGDLAQFNPVTYGVQPIRALFVNDWPTFFGLLPDLAVIAVFSIAMITIATVLFRRSIS